MKKTKVVIIGAGAGGLGTACWLKNFGVDFVVIDAAKELTKNLHNGVHYLHSRPNLPYDFEFDLKEITLTDGIIDKYGDIKHNWNLQDILEYSEKVREIQHPSSIMDIGKRDMVYMPSSNTLNTLIEKMYDYAGKENFIFGETITNINRDTKEVVTEKGLVINYDYLVSTMPLNIFQGFFRLNDEYKSNPIFVTNFKLDKIVPNWLINLYIPDSHSNIYRGSILNSLLSVESIDDFANEEYVKFVFKMFHIKEKLNEYEWKTGKVISIDMDKRLELIELFRKYDCFSLGRFGMWNRKLLIDSTINQAQLIASNIANTKDWNTIKFELMK